MPISSSFQDELDKDDRYAQPFSGFSDIGENFDAGIGEVFDEYSSFSSVLNRANFNNRNSQLTALKDSGKIPEDIFKSYLHSQVPVEAGHGGSSYKADWDGLASWANENLTELDPISTNEELMAERDAEMAMKRRYREDIFERSTGAGTAAAFAGTLLGSAVDPFNLAAGTVLAPLSVGSVVASRALYAASVAGRSALGGIASQAALEPLIHVWQEQTGGEYGWKDSAFNLAAAGVFSASISGTASFFGHARALKVQTRKGTASFIEDILVKKELNKAELTLELKDLDPRSQEYRDVAARMQQSEQEFDSLVTHWKNNPDDIASITHMFSELDTLKTYVDDGADIKQKFETLEATLESMETAHARADDPPQVINPERPKTAPRETIDPQKAAEERSAKQAEKKKKIADGDDDEAKASAKLLARYNELKAKLPKLLEEIDASREKFRSDEIFNTYERRIERLEKKAKNAKSEGERLDAENDIFDLQEKQKQTYDELPEKQQMVVDKRFKKKHAGELDKIVEEMNEIEGELNLKEVTDPLDAEVRAIGDDVMIEVDGELRPIKDALYDDIASMETESRVLEDTLQCMLRNQIG